MLPLILGYNRNAAGSELKADNVSWNNKTIQHQDDMQTELGSECDEAIVSEVNSENNETVSLAEFETANPNLARYTSTIDHPNLNDDSSVELTDTKLARTMAERLVQAALLAGSRNNITAMVVIFPGCKYKNAM